VSGSLLLKKEECMHIRVWICGRERKEIYRI